MRATACSTSFASARAARQLAARTRIGSRDGLGAHIRFAQAACRQNFVVHARDRAPDAPLAWPSTESVHAQKLDKLLADSTKPAEFYKAAREELAAILSAAEASAAEVQTGDVLSLRIKQLQEKERRRRAVEEILALMAKRLTLHYFHPLEAVPIAAPKDGASFEHLVKLTEHEMGAITELESYLNQLVPPLADQVAICRLDRTQGAQLYLGAMQFAYFVASIFSKIRSSESSGEGPLQMSPVELQALSKRPRTEEAWAVAQGRAGALWRLAPDPRGGYPQLTEFSTRVSLAPSAAVGEFFEQPADRGSGDGAEAGGTPGAEAAMPAAELLPMQTGTLRTLLTEGCALGWALQQAELQVLSNPMLLGLLTPQSGPGGGAAGSGR